MVSIAELDVSVMGNYFFLLEFKKFLNVLGIDIDKHLKGFWLGSATGCDVPLPDFRRSNGGVGVIAIVN